MSHHLYSTITIVSNCTDIISYEPHLDPHSNFVSKEMEAEWHTGMTQGLRRPVLTHVKPSQVRILPFQLAAQWCWTSNTVLASLWQAGDIASTFQCVSSHPKFQNSLSNLSNQCTERGKRRPTELWSRIYAISPPGCPTPRMAAAPQPCSSVSHRHWYYKSEAPRIALSCLIPNVNSTYPEGLLS